MISEQRTRHFVNSSVQGALAWRLVFHWLLFLFVGVAVTFLLLFFSNPFESASVHWNTLLQTNGPFVVVGLLLLPIFVIDSIALSHRWTGPLVRVRQQMRTMASGDEGQKIKLRPGDFWHDFSEDFNALVAKHNEDLPGTSKDVQHGV